MLTWNDCWAIARKARKVFGGFWPLEMMTVKTGGGFPRRCRWLGWWPYGGDGWGV